MAKFDDLRESSVRRDENVTKEFVNEGETRAQNVTAPAPIFRMLRVLWSFKGCDVARKVKLESNGCSDIEARTCAPTPLLYFKPDGNKA